MLSGTALAFSGQKSIQAVYNNIKLVIDGKPYTPKDASGNVVEPFTYNGTTYVPLRAVATAFGKDVNWDAASATVTIGSQNSTWLDSMGAYEFTTASGDSKLESVGKVKDYSRGLKLVVDADADEIATEECKATFLLNGQYKTLSGFLLCTDNREAGTIKVYGDGKLLFTSPGLTRQTVPVELTLDLTSVQQLTIEGQIKASGTYLFPNYCDVVFADTRLTK